MGSLRQSALSKNRHLDATKINKACLLPCDCCEKEKLVPIAVHLLAISVLKHHRVLKIVQGYHLHS